MGTLIEVTEKIVVDTEDEAIQLIDRARNDSSYELKKSGYVAKTKKSRREVIATWFTVTLVKSYAPECPLDR